MIVFTTIFIVLALIGFYTVVDSLKTLTITLLNKRYEKRITEDVES